MPSTGTVTDVFELFSLRQRVGELERDNARLRKENRALRSEEVQRPYTEDEKAHCEETSRIVHDLHRL